MIRHTSEPFRWQDVAVHPYKEDGGTHFKSITRQTLLNGTDDIPVEFRYFEIGTDGHSTLEKHVHQHAVMVIRGSGQVLVRDTVTPINTFDIVHIPAMTWHQFRATNNEELGFLCIVSNERDRPQRPTPEDLEMLRSNQEVGAFIRV